MATFSRERTLRAQARELYRVATRANAAEAPQSESAARAADALDTNGATSLTERARALYEGGIVPVREIARLCGVSERTLYKYRQRGGWQQRVHGPAGDGARAGADGRAEGRRAAGDGERGPADLVARGAGGRFVARADKDKPHAHGLKALDPKGAAAASVRCVEAEALAASAAVQAQARRARVQAEKDAQASLRTLETLCAALVELAGLECTQARAQELAARLETVLIAQIARLVAPVLR